MKFLLFIPVLAILISNTNAILPPKNVSIANLNHPDVLVNVKIYSNLAEIIQPIDKFPLEFSGEDWSNIRPDSITLVGPNVTITRQTITVKNNWLNNAHIYVRSPLSSNTKVQYLKAIMIDENRNLIKTIDKSLSKEPIYFTVPSDHILYVNEPPQSIYYVDFTYHTTDIAYVSYLRSNLNWKTRYQLYFFEESKDPILIVMADIRNDGKSKINIEHAELLGGDTHLQMSEQKSVPIDSNTDPYIFYWQTRSPSVAQGKEVAGLYVFAIDQPFSIDAKTNYLLPMFRPHVVVERFGFFLKLEFLGSEKSTTKAQRTYRLSSDHFLSSGNCMIREYEHLVGETFLPDLAAQDKHEFSIGEDSDIIYKENVTLVSSSTYNESVRSDNTVEQRTKMIYDVNGSFKNFKKNRSVKIEFKQILSGKSVKLIKFNGGIIQDGTDLKCKMTLTPDEEKFLSYNVEIVK